MQQFDPYIEWLRDLFYWREKRTGVIMPEERLPWPNTVGMGMQHVLAMFGSTVIAPLIMGFNVNVAILFSGIGTLIFFLITQGKIPSYLGSSFAFLAPVGAVMDGGGSIGDALGGIIAAGLIYLAIGLAVQYVGSDWIDALMPPLVTGAVVTIIGLNLASSAQSNSSQSMPLALLTILGIIAIAILGRGMLGRLPILLGTVFAYLVALILGGTSADGRSIGPMHVSGVNFQPVKDAAWIGWPNFTGPSFSWHAISLIAPVAIILVAENTGHIKAVSAMTGRNLMPFLGRGFIGDGVATTIAGLGGGTGVTTYAENIGVMAVTRVFSTAIFVVAAGTAIVLGFIPKFGALIGSIPAGVLGGVSTVLFGLIAITGVRIWVEAQVDFSKATNLFIAGVTVIIGAADYTLNIGSFALGGIGLGTFGAIILYQIFRYAGLENVDLIPATDEVAGPARGARPRNASGGGRGRDSRDRRPARGQEPPRERVREGDPGANRAPRSEPTMALDPRALREAFGGDNPPRRQAPEGQQRRPARPQQASDPTRQSQPQPRRRQPSQPQPYGDDEFGDAFVDRTPQARPRRQPAPDPRDVGQQRRPAPPAGQPRRETADDRPRRPAPQQPPQSDPRPRRPAPRPRTNQPPDDEDGDY